MTKVKILSAFDAIEEKSSALLNTESLMKCVFKSNCTQWFNKEDLFKKLNEEITELKAEADAANFDKEKAKSEIGDVLNIMTQIAMFYDIDVEDALNTTNERIEKRFRHVEAGLISDGKDFRTASVAEIGKYWSEIKKIEKAS